MEWESVDMLPGRATATALFMQFRVQSLVGVFVLAFCILCTTSVSAAGAQDLFIIANAPGMITSVPKVGSVVLQFLRTDLGK